MELGSYTVTRADDLLSLAFWTNALNQMQFKTALSLAETQSTIKDSEYLPAIRQRIAPESGTAVTGTQVRSFHAGKLLILTLKSNKRTGTILVHLEIL